MGDYSVTPYLPNDVLFERLDTDCGTSNVWLKDALDQMIIFTETVLCEWNAKDVHEVAIVLDLCASRLHQQYDIWKQRNFEKVK